MCQAHLSMAVMVSEITGMKVLWETKSNCHHLFMYTVLPGFWKPVFLLGLTLQQEMEEGVKLGLGGRGRVLGSHCGSGNIQRPGERKKHLVSMKTSAH